MIEEYTQLVWEKPGARCVWDEVSEEENGRERESDSGEESGSEIREVKRPDHGGPGQPW